MLKIKPQSSSENTGEYNSGCMELIESRGTA